MNTFDPKNTVMSVGGFDISSGFAPDSQIEVDRDEDGYSAQQGTGGEVVRSKSPNKMGKITVTMMAASQANDYLSGIAAVDDGPTSGGVVSVSGSDLNGTTKFGAAEAWVVKLPKIERGKEHGTTQYVFHCAVLESFAGGLL